MIITREQIAQKARKSVKTLRRWEQWGVLPRPDEQGYSESDVLGCVRWSDVESIVLVNRSLYLNMKDGTTVRHPSKPRIVKEQE